MRILAIETSCDETGIALLEVKGSLEKPEITVISNALLSQVKLHEEYGGVYPHLAKREHEKNLPILLEKVLKEAGEDSQSPNLDIIAVTTGPGLEPALWTGITFAEKLAQKWAKPLVPINHMIGHIYSVLYQSQNSLKFPALALLVSGGHTELVKVDDWVKFELIGKTQDDAVGEAFDKVARMLGLTYPGGPKISQLAEFARNHPNTEIRKGLSLPRPMIHTKDFNFSYSGLKTAVLYKLKVSGEVTEDFKREVAREFEDAAVEVLVEKTRRALEKFPEIRTLIVAGGVSANKHLSREIKSMTESYPQVTVHFPNLELSTDNAVMIGIAAFVKVWSGYTPEPGPFIAKGNLPIA